MKKNLLWLFTALLPLFAASCSINRSLYPVQSERRVDGAMLAGVWEGNAKAHADADAMLVKAVIRPGTGKDSLLVELELTPEDDEEQTDRIMPLAATIYEIDGVKFLNLAADEDSLYRMIGKAGYSGKGVNRGLLHPWVFLFKIEFTADRIEIASVSFVEQDERGKSGKSGKPRNPNARFDRSKGALLNSSAEIGAIVREKGYAATPLLTLNRVKK